MNALLIGIGAAGNKAVVTAIEKGTMNVEDTAIVNSTTKDFPKEYQGTKIVLSATDTGCGKERDISKMYTKKAIGEGKFNFNEKMSQYTTVIICTSVEGGTGSGATPILAKFFNKVYTKNVHIIAFTGFEDDVRGLANTVEFFKEIDSAIIVQTISNTSYFAEAGYNKMKAEELANVEMAERIRVLIGKDFIEGSQNIDDTDILKLSNTSGYMTVEKKYFKKSLETRDDFEKIIKNMVYNSASIKSKNPSAIRIGVILNINSASEDAIDYSFSSLKAAYGNPFELYTQIQWDKKTEYIAYIASGMKMPIDEISAIFERYKEQSKLINKNGDEFFATIGGMSTLAEDSKFNMIKEVSKGISVADFLSEEN